MTRESWVRCIKYSRISWFSSVSARQICCYAKSVSSFSNNEAWLMSHNFHFIFTFENENKSIRLNWWWDESSNGCICERELFICYLIWHDLLFYLILHFFLIVGFHALPSSDWYHWYQSSRWHKRACKHETYNHTHKKEHTHDWSSREHTHVHPRGWTGNLIHI